ncbi:radical SAM/SPASM domain-containing protein [Chitinophaga sancti]|uniref:4Fe-4S single cluster domain-containing protein n=1 Tax=Chitinophaga sancti TaxID=1004 RepID=A0A1K1LR90_9BACT|nr:radical SAM protein [Chitinophaga sancti]WQD64905.1 SPASM domain-containing protein [Chitinophaga sancti]WQG89471.1 SPASM domain-containing protein [Chitinophaga sancti]SFW13437.1 4Fe-4S single cluster domain-containing protein [Chitinophaga sancti]
MIKFSHYNELIPIRSSGDYLLYNIISGGLQVLTNRLGKVVSELSVLPEFTPAAYPALEEELSRLASLGFFVDNQLDEIANYQQNYHNSQLRKYTDNSHIGLTIGTTITCNMGCPYCFEVIKPNKSLRDKEVVEGIAAYIEDMIQRAPVKKWSSLSIVWYGGEPLINKEAIRQLSAHFIPLCEKYNIAYDASIITNGILLDRENWFFLKENQVKDVQITIDGSKEVHDVYRPLKSRGGKNYEKILEHLSMMPLGMNANIRINTDKRVAATLPALLDDLQAYGIWPQRFREVSIKLAWMRAYKDADIADLRFMTQEEFFEAEHAFSELLIEKFASWPGHTNVKPPKLKWKFPEKQSDCATYVSPYSFTFDTEGTIHKCWETIHDTRKSSGQQVFASWDPEDFRKYLDYNRTTVHPTCYNCKFNPVCEGLSCAYDTLNMLKENELPCTAWKTQLPAYFEKMYDLMQENEDRVVIATPKNTAHQTHANK